MRWLKRNMLLVVGILVALCLLGGAIAYLVTAYNDADELQTKFEAVREEFKKYQEMAPTPNKENIALAEADTKRLTLYMGDVRKLFKTPAYTKMDDMGFKSLLDNTISELSRGATNAAVTIPDKYKFTFAAQVSRTRFASNSIPALWMQLMEVKSICNLLYQAKIVSLDVVKRAPVSIDDTPPTAGDYLDRRITTNTYGVVVPYEVSFKCFSTELGNVVNALANTEEFFLIKNLQVQGEPPPATATPTEMASPPPPPNPPKAGKAPPRPPPAKPVLDERALRVTLQIDLMRAPQPAK